MLHTEEFEILLPNRNKGSREQPLLLSIGPSVSMAIPILLMAAFSSKIYGSGNHNFIYMSLITGGTGALMGVLWGITNQRYRRKTAHKEDNELTEEFDRYLCETKKYLSEAAKDNREHMLTHYPNGEYFLDKVDEAYLFKRYRQDEDYLFLRYKLGKCPFQMKIKIAEGTKTMFPSQDLLKAMEIKNKFDYIDSVPLCIDMKKDRHIGLNLPSDSERTYEFILSLIIQIAGLFSPSDMKMCLFYSPDNEYQKRVSDSVKWLPHVFTDGMKNRLIAGPASSVSRVSLMLEELMEREKYFLTVFVLDDRFLLEETICQKLYSGETDLRVCVFHLKKKEYLPVSVSLIIEEDDIEEHFEGVSFKKAFEFNSKMAALKIDIGHTEEPIPDKVDFFSLFDTESLEGLEVSNRWANAKPAERIKAPIGISQGAVKQYLDVHEKYHGPHGLIAGTTGSGKSELLQTYLMSLCISFSPSQVNFFLIDYKGGGTGNYICDLPHCAGVISNLSGESIDRAMKAIGSENRRRQKLLAEYGVNHVDSYAELVSQGIATEPMPHLILIVDEFAELKKEEPEFMQQIISLAAVGRSLGIHLILATQKPAGVVDDKIWSNSHFKLCLKVQDKQDSMDMLHRPEASLLKNPGQCYIQIGNNEYFNQFQTGYLGGTYSENGEDEPDMYLLDETGMRMCLPRPMSLMNAPLKIEALVNHVNSVAKELGYGLARPLWMDELPLQVGLSTILGRERRRGIFALGIYDDPLNQNQGTVYFCAEKMGHLAIAGGPSTGKSSMMTTMISQVEESDEYLIIDVSQKTIAGYERRINCRGSLTEISGIPVFFYHLKNEFEFRKRCRTEHNLYVFIDNFQSLYKHLDEEKQELITSMISEGIGIGMLFIISGSSPADFPSKIFSKIKNTIAFEMNDQFMYSDMLRKFRLNVRPKANTPGRFLYSVRGEVLECQCALVDEIVEETKPRRSFPKIPDNPIINDFNDYALMRLPRDTLYIGYSLKSGYERGVSLQKGGSFTISGGNGSGRHTLLENIGTTLQSVNGMSDEDVYYCPEGIIEEDRLLKAKALLCPDLGNLARNMYSKGMNPEMISIIEDGAGMKSGLFLAGIYDPSKDVDVMLTPLFRIFSVNGQGIHLGGNASSQRMLDVSDLSYSETSRPMKAGYGVMRVMGHSNTLLIRVPSGKESEKQNDYD